MPTLDYSERVDATMGNIDASSEIHEDNKTLLAEFKRDLALEGKSDARIQKLTSHLKVIAEEVGETRFEDMDEDHVKALVEWVQGRDLADVTVNDYKKAIKQFWKWLGGDEDEYPEAVDWITTTGQNGNGNGTLPKDLLTRDDIDALKAACRNDRDRAFIAMLYETGARIGELIDLTVGDIEDHKHGRKVVIDGKTGQRRLPLLESSPAINDWLNDHPDPEKDAPLWCHLRDGDKQLSYKYIREKLLGRAKKRAGLEKPINPHHFRHSRATELAQKFKEAQLCEWFGWVQGSKVPAKYVHLSGRDIDDAYGKLHGLVDEDEDEERTVTECWRCEELNEPDRKFCGGCGAALDVDAAQEIETAESKTTSGADPEDLELALKLVDKIGERREEIEAFVEEDV